MSANRVTCPECGKVLQLPRPLFRGERARCPGCRAVFSGPEETESAAAIQSRQDRPVPESSPGARPRRTFEADDEDYRPRRRRSAVDEPTDDYPSDDDADSWEEDRSLDLRRRRSKSRTGLCIGIGIGGAAALVLLFMFLGFVWPGLFVARASSQADLLAFLPADTTMAMGVDLSKQKNAPQEIENLRAGLQAVPGVPLEALDLLKDGDRLIVGANLSGLAPTFGVVFRTKSPYDPAKVRRIFQTGQPKTIAGKTCFILHQGLLQGYFLGLADDRTIVFGSPNLENEFAPAIGKRQPTLSADFMSQIQVIDRYDFWGVVAYEGKIKGLVQQLPPLLALKPGANELAVPLQRAKGISFWGEKSGEKGVKFHVGMTCGDSGDARLLQAKVTDLWNQGGKIVMTMGRGLVAGQPGGQAVGGFFDDIQKSFEVNRKGLLVYASAEISSQTVQAMEAQQKQLLAGWPAGNQFPAINPPPNIKLPPFGGQPIPPLKGKIIFSVNDSLTPATVAGKAHNVQLTAGKTYSIDMVSNELDAFLRLKLRGQEVAADDDGGGALNARIIFAAQESGLYQIMASALDRRPGRYALTVREIGGK